MTQDIHTADYTLGEQFATYVAYGDVDTLSTGEEDSFIELEARARDAAPTDYTFSHWSIGDDANEFTQCEATGLMGRCLTFTAVYTKENQA